MPRARTLWMLLVVVAAGCARNAPAPTPPPGGASQRLEIASSGHLLVTATIDGHPCVLVLDTGANITSLSTAAARRLGIEPTGTIEINNTIVAPTGTVRSLSLSGVEHEDVPIAVVDIPAALATGAEGILGLDVFARHDFVVDLLDDEFGVFPAGALARSRRDLVDFEYGANGLILLDVVVDDRTTMPAMLDLGAPVTILNRRAGAVMGARGANTPIVARTGHRELAPVHALVSDLGTFDRLGLAHRPAIVLGSDAFEDRVLAISYRDRVAFVSPAAASAR